MYIIYPPREKDWRHKVFVVLALAMLYPLLKLGGFFPQPVPADFNSIPDQELAMAAHTFTLKMSEPGGALTNFIENFAQMIHGFYRGFLSLDGFYPLYPSLLVTITQKDFNDFVSNAIGLNFLLLLFFLALLFFTLRRIEGEFFGFLAVSFLFFFSPLLWKGQQFGAELIVLTCSYLCWFNLVEEEETNHGRNFSAGMWSGLAFLTAPFGGFLFLTVILYFLVTFHIHLFKQKSWLSFLLGFILLASPILVRDLWLHQNPLYSLLLHLKTVSLDWNFLQEGNKLLWIFYLLGLGAFVFDPNSRRRNLSLLLACTALIGHFIFPLFFVTAFYLAALAHTLLAKLLKKQTLWLGFTLALGLCSWSWIQYLNFIR